VCQNTNTDLFAENCPINGASGTSYIQWHYIFSGNDVMFASNIANNAGSSNYQNFTFSNSGQYQIYYEIGNIVGGVFVPTGGVSFGSFLIVNVINSLPTGNFSPPFNLCLNSTSIIFNYTGQPGIIDFTQSTIDLGDGNGPQLLTQGIFNQLTTFGLNTFYGNTGTYTVTLTLYNACGGNTFTQNYTVYDQIPITANDVNICEGTVSIDLFANVPTGVTIEWFSNGNLLGIGNPLSLIPAPNTTTTYTAIASLPGGCNGTDNLTVSIIPEQTIEIEGPPTNCNWQNAVYNILNPEPGVIYTWNITNGYPSVATGSTVNITWDQNNLSQGGTIEISAVGFPCLLTNIINIEPCCVSNEVATLIIDCESDNNPNTNQILLSHYFPNPNGTTLIGPQFLYGGNSYSSLVFGGAVVVDIDFTISSDIIVDMLPQASINVIAGKTLTIENGTVLKAACKEMWQGIRVPDGANLVLNSGCIIQDAEVGVLTGANSTLNFGASGAKVRFNKNYIGVGIINHSTPNNLRIQNTVFECRTGAYSSDELLLSPYTGEISAIGVYLLKNTQTITIGQIAANQNNVFDNLLYGVVSFESNFRLYNNSFDHISYDDQTQYTTFDCNCKCLYGTAVCANGRLGSYTATIGANALSYPAAINSVTNSDNGFNLYSNMNAIIESNTMFNIKNNGIVLSQNYRTNGVYQIKGNNLKDVQFNHILISDNPKTYKNIENNDINESYTPNYLYSTGIQIMEYAKAPLPVTVIDNHIKQVQTGIYTSKVNLLKVNNNYIDLNANPDMSQGFGIVVWYGQSHSITNNQIRAANRNNYYVDGIRLEYTPKTTVSCNSMERTGSGVFLNGTCTDSKIHQNNLRRNFWGYIINNAVSGLQQPNMYSDNIWTGPYDNNTLDGGTYWHTFNMGSDPYQNAMNVRNHTLPGNVHKPVPFYAKNDFGNNTFNLWPHPVNPTDGPIYYPNLYSNTNNPDYGSCLNVIATDTTEGEAQLMQQIINNNVQLPEYNQENLWWMQYQLYVSAKEDATLANQPGMQAFINDMEQLPIGKLEQITTLLGDSTSKDSLNLIAIKNQNDAIGISNTMESLFKQMNGKVIDIALTEISDDFNGYGLSELEENEIEALAQECPFEKGPAVFIARVLIKKLRPESGIYLNYCEKVQPEQSNRSSSPFPFEYEYDPSEEHDMDYLLKQDNITFVNELKLYPNPSNSMINLESPELITKVEISNMIGQVILFDNTSAANKVSIDMKGMPKGLYLIKVFNNDNFVVKQLSLIE
jgi:hypothetical protein